jgi:hypothetical protein
MSMIREQVIEEVVDVIEAYIEGDGRVPVIENNVQSQ